MHICLPFIELDCSIICVLILLWKEKHLIAQISTGGTKMKMNAEEKNEQRGESRDLDALVEKGRQLHSKALFELCASLFKRIHTSNQKTKIMQQNQRLADSHCPR